MPAACGCAPRSIRKLQDQARAGAARRPAPLRPRARLVAARSAMSRSGRQLAAARLLNANIALDYRRLARGDRARARRRRGDARLRQRHDRHAAALRRAQMPVRGDGGTAFDALKAGDIIAVAPEGGDFALRAIPKISGGFVVEEPRDRPRAGDAGRLRRRARSRSTARPRRMRQPGSTIKPIVYAAALDNGMTPGLDHRRRAVLRLSGRAARPEMLPQLRRRAAASGPHTMRWGIEQSRNLMTVRTASADRHGQRRRADQADRRRRLSALSLLSRSAPARRRWRGWSTPIRSSPTTAARSRRR